MSLILKTQRLWLICMVHILTFFYLWLLKIDLLSYSMTFDYKTDAKANKKI